LVIAERRDASHAAADAVRQGLKEGLSHGSTTIGEIASAKAESYIDMWPSFVIFAEVIGFSRARADSAFAAAGEYLKKLRRCARRAELGVSPHAPYTVSPELLRRFISFAKQRVLPVAIHLAESQEELDFLANGTGPFQELLEERSMWDPEAVPRGSRPMDYLRMMAEAPRALVIHGNYLDAEERAFLAANAERMSLVYCPRTHAYFGHPRYPLPELLKAGVRVALGTDSRASNPDLDLLAEMRFVAQTFPEIAPQAVLRLGTLAGAEALRRAAEVGSITLGKFADLVAVPLDGVQGSATDEVLAGMLNGSTKPSAVWLRGNRVR
jgi:cytosine/adenosine deaminase-related metal-dependent hydrolase